MGDLFGTLRELPSVARISNLAPDHPLPLEAVFFICPPMTGQGFRVNEVRTGLRAAYAEGTSASTIARVARVQAFAAEARTAGLHVSITAILAAADSMLLFPVPIEAPPVPDEIDGITVVSNLGPVQANLGRFGTFYRERPWSRVPQRWVTGEEQRLRAMLPAGVPDHLADDLIRRIFAGFALDGLLLREERFGPNPVILGVESPGVPVLQNAALQKGSWLPVVQLR